MAQKEGLVALVVTYNRLEKLQATLARLLDSPPGVLRAVLVFDNAAEDGTAAWLAAQRDDRLAVIRSAENLGGAGGFAAAIAAARDRFDPDWLVLMDDDARPAPGVLARFAAGRRDGFDAWAAAVTYPDGRICDMNRPWINPFRSGRDLFRGLARGRDGFHLTQADYAGETVKPVDGGSFVGLFLSRRALALAGLPDARLFLYGDDVLYTLGLTRAGGRIGFDPALVFEHDCATLRPGGALSPLWRAYYFHRNQVLVYRAAAGPVLFWPVVALKAASWALRARAYSRPLPYLRLLGLALGDGLRGRLDRPRAEVLARAGAP
jgi:GT2 family glycosyltransferase